jgi:GNAT superfamily N-acetyltransferase
LARKEAKRKPATRALTIRRAGLSDLETLVHQRRAMWMDLGVRDQERLESADKSYRRWIKARLKNRTLFAWLVQDRGGRIAGGGCLWLHPIQPNPRRSFMLQPYLLSMFTEPDFRRRGVASMVVSKAIEWSKKQGYGRLMLHASDMGRKVYSKFGFRRTWEMRLDLEEPKRSPKLKRPPKR